MSTVQAMMHGRSYDCKTGATLAPKLDSLEMEIAQARAAVSELKLSIKELEDQIGEYSEEG
ncbi:hypothetical protein SAMN05660916_00574 [Arthrobacter sp. 31Cvi3.1E]|nr:hypothetical protein SAMN05660916_00574 [Arthrobacter sp. 31Cvi3.1E]